MRHLEDTDPIPLVLAHLSQDQRVQASLEAGHVSGIREAPWPCLVVESGSDNLGDGRGGLVMRGVSLALFDSFEEAHGSWKSRRTLLAAVQALVQLAERDEYDPTDPIVVSVVTDGQVYAMRSTAGQQRYMTDVTLRMAPSEVPSAAPPPPAP